MSKLGKICQRRCGNRRPFAGAETPAKAYVNPEQTVGDHFKRIGVETAKQGPQLPLTWFDECGATFA